MNRREIVRDCTLAECELAIHATYVERAQMALFRSRLADSLAEAVMYRGHARMAADGARRALADYMRQKENKE